MPNTDVWARIAIQSGDITKLETDAIVNAANEQLAGGGGVDGAIHRAAGPELPVACAALGGCPTGDAKITPGFNLPARWIVHTVGPVYRDGSRDEAALLASCYQRSMQVAVEHGARTVAFPAISTGVYGYPFEDATRIAIDTVASFLASEGTDTIDQVVLIFHGDRDFDAAKRIFEENAR